jgi:hypothetical protein
MIEEDAEKLELENEFFKAYLKVSTFTISSAR